MRRSNWLAIAIVSTLIFAIGCAKVPQQSINEAKAAIDNAKESGAETYSPDLLKSALVSFELAMTEISGQSKKMPFMRKYDKANEYLQSATQAAMSARNEVDVAKDKLRSQTQGILAQAQQLSDTAAVLLERARKKKKDVGTVSSDLDTAKAWIIATNASISSGDFLVAKEKATTIIEKLSSIKSSLTTLLAVSGKKRK